MTTFRNYQRKNPTDRRLLDRGIKELDAALQSQSKIQELADKRDSINAEIATLAEDRNACFAAINAYRFGLVELCKTAGYDVASIEAKFPQTLTEKFGLNWKF